jgi:riboflavin biosynthesis pyrimidine reductase
MWMREFKVLFDGFDDEAALAEAAVVSETKQYGRLSFPKPPAGRPWIYANFVQTLDGIVSLLGDEPSGGDLNGIAEDRWLMDLLRAHADAVLLGMGTLREEQRLQRPRPRGPVFRIVDPELRELRARLSPGRKRERNIFVSARAEFQMKDYAVFDGELVDVSVVTTREGARRLEAQGMPHVDVIAVDGASHDAASRVDLRQAVAALTARYGLRYLLCEGGPQLYSGMLKAELIDEQFLTVAPLEVGRVSVSGPRPTRLPNVGFSRQDAARWRWLSCRRVEDYQFHRFRRRG